MRIGEYNIGKYLEPYIVAEIGVNHEGSMGRAMEMIEQAADSGAHAVKFQFYKADKLASRNSPAYWDRKKNPVKSQYELFRKYDTFEPENYQELARHCRLRGIHFICTPFDPEAVDILSPLVSAFKIASADITNLPLLRKVAGEEKPVILSTGASTLPEIAFAVQELLFKGASQIALLHCVLNYPTSYEDAQLSRILTLKRAFPDHTIGYSDHVPPDHTLQPLEMATLLGASILEKHFTYDKSLPGNDHYHAMDRTDLQDFTERLLIYRRLFGTERRDLSGEADARSHARRSIVAARRIQKGDIFTEENITAKRPGHGISPVHWDEIIGKSAARNIEEDELIGWSDLT